MRKQQIIRLLKENPTVEKCEAHVPHGLMFYFRAGNVQIVLHRLSEILVGISALASDGSGTSFVCKASELRPIPSPGC
jgi:hypothetical protein